MQFKKGLLPVPRAIPSKTTLRQSEPGVQQDSSCGSAKHPIVSRGSRAQRFVMPIFPAVALLAVVLLVLLAGCHFFQGRRHKNHASRKGPDE